MHLSAGPETSEIFAANRSRGTVRLTVGAVNGGVTRRRRVHEAGSLRVRFPATSAGELEAVLLNTAGGLAGGDAYEVDISVLEHARLVVTSAAAEKIYRTIGPSASIDVRIEVAAGGNLAWLPQETILFDNAGLSRRIDVDLDATAKLLLAEAVVFGRRGKGEVVMSGALHERWRVRREGRLIYADGMMLNGPIADKLGELAVAGGGRAIATLLMSPGGGEDAENIHALTGNLLGELGVSAWNGLLLMRFCAPDSLALRSDLTNALTTLRSAPLPRLWIN